MKWAGTIACGLIVVMAATCLCGLGGWLDRGNWNVGFACGAFQFGWVDESSPSVPLSLQFNQVENSPQNWAFFALWPQYQEAPYEGASVPLWIPFVLVAFPTALLWRADRRRPLPGHCRKCNYNLTGNTSGVCPECGAATHTAPKRFVPVGDSDKLPP